ncbi:paramyosin-like [Epinephelus fuscoguttatus]|uniref:paramyosin-like n=1 Tax=Epinephelus fuscoguttatus TaxID=293821 RepID=UPI0020D172B1|nr:paramyosin-like [Epinephelus fuscoguttatus]
MAPSTAQNNDDPEYLRWQIAKLDDFKDSLLEMNAKRAVEIQALEADKETLKADLETAKAEIRDLHKQSEESDAEKKKLFDETMDLTSKLMDWHLQHNRDTEALEKKLSDSRDTITALKKEHESDLLRVRADWEGKLAEEQAKWETEAAEERRKDAAAHADEVTEIHYSYVTQMTEYKEQLASLQGKLQEQRQYFTSALTAAKIKFEDELSELKEKNWELKRTVYAQKHLKEEVLELKEAVKEKDEIIETKEKLIAKFREDRQNLLKDWQSARDSKAAADASLKDLTTSHADLQSKLKATRSELSKSKTWQEKAGAELLELVDAKKRLLDQRNKLTSQVAEQKKKICELESTQHRFKTDLEACSSSMSDFKSLKSKYVELCRRYLHNYRPCEVKLDLDLEDELREKIACADRKLSSYQKTIKNGLRDVKYYQDLFDKNLNVTQVYVDKVHKLEKENNSLKNDLRHTQLLLQKATKPVQQRVKSWIDKKVLGRVAVAPEAAEEPPAHYPDNWQPSDLPDDNIVSSVQPCPSEPSASSEPDPLDGVIVVKPCVVKDLPPADE